MVAKRPTDHLGVAHQTIRKICPEIMAEPFPERTDSRRFWSFPQGIGKEEALEHKRSQRECSQEERHQQQPGGIQVSIKKLQP